MNGKVLKKKRGLFFFFFFFSLFLYLRHITVITIRILLCKNEKKEKKNKDNEETLLIPQQNSLRNRQLRKKYFTYGCFFGGISSGFSQKKKEKYKKLSNRLSNRESRVIPGTFIFLQIFSIFSPFRYKLIRDGCYLSPLVKGLQN